MGYYNYPEPPRMRRPAKPTWQSLMGGSRPPFQRVIDELEAAGHAIDHLDSRMLLAASERANAASADLKVRHATPAAFWSLLTTRGARISYGIAELRDHL